MIYDNSNNYTRNIKSDPEANSHVAMYQPDYQVHSYGTVYTLQFVGRFRFLLVKREMKISLIQNTCCTATEFYKSILVGSLIFFIKLGQIGAINR